MKLHTVNVIEYTDDTIKSVRSFSDDKEGRRQAEELFESVAHENGLKGEAGPYIDDGIFEKDAYQIFITHSD